MFIISVIAFQIFVFFALILIMRRIMLKNFVSATKHLEDMNQDYSKKEADINKKIQDLKDKSEQAILNAHSEGEKKRIEIIKEAEEARERLLKQAKLQSEEIIQQADRSREQLMLELDKKIEERAIKKALSLVGEVLPEDFRRDIHSKWLKDLVETGFNRLERFQIESGIDKVKVMSAFSLNEEEKSLIKKKLHHLLKKEVDLDELIDEGLIAGAIVTIGNLVLDGSLKHKITEKTREIN